MISTIVPKQEQAKGSKRMSSTLLYAEVNAVCILFLCIIGWKARSVTYYQRVRWLFIMVVFSNALLFTLDVLWILVDGKTILISRIGNWILNAAYYCISGWIGYIWFVYAENSQHSARIQVLKYRLVMMLPALPLTFLTFLSLSNKWLFYIDESNVYHRGSGYALQITLSFGYILLSAVKAFVRSFHAQCYDDVRSVA